MDGMEELIGEFLMESHESLDRLDEDLVALEDRPRDPDLLANIFRAVHTIKGTCGFLSFVKLERVTHAGENLLSMLRDGELLCTPRMVTALLELTDAMRSILNTIEQTSGEGQTNYQTLVAEFECLVMGDHASARQPLITGLSAEVTVADTAPPLMDAGPNGTTSAAQLDVGADGRLIVPDDVFEIDGIVLPPPSPRRITPQLTDFEVSAAGKILVPDDVLEIDGIELPPPTPKRGAPRPTFELVTPEADPQPAKVGAEPSEAKAPETTAPDAKAKAPKAIQQEANIRVGVGLLDELMNLVGELVLTRNQMLQFSDASSDPNFHATTQRLSAITSELQEGVMKTRMQPIGTVWQKFPRLARDIARSCGKKVRIEMEGKETELDRTIVEAIKDPLTHIIRNSIDHGIESPSVRAAAGKNIEGTIRLRAYHEGGQVNITISDDGAGIDPERIRAKAIAKRLVSIERSRLMSDRDLLHLIFAPGFSTAEKVTNISGRGVGMDVVKTNVERIGGSIDVSSSVGRGTTLKMKIPLTLAIVPALMVEASGHRFAIPQVSLRELVRLEGDAATTAVETIYGAPVFRLRERLLPLIRLHEALELPEPAPCAPGMIPELNIVVVQADDRSFGIIVDEILDSEEIVVKGLGKQVKGIPCFAGATIMGDGHVALILDVVGLAQGSGLGDGTVSRDTDRAETTRSESTAQMLLIFGVGERRRMAVPLEAVSRLEEFDRDAVELAAGSDAIQYRGGILPLIHVADHIGGCRPPTEVPQLLPVVVFAGADTRRVGLVVDHIIDIVEEDIEIQGLGTRGMVVGSAIVQEKVTDLLDARGLIERFDPAFFEAGDAA